MNYSLNKLYRAAKVTKQAVWEHFKREEATLALIRRVVGQVDGRREEHPGEGLAKLYWQIQPEGMGRDKFCHTFKGLGYGLVAHSNPVRTTVPARKVFDNLIKGRVIGGPNQVWQSDITYIKIGERFYYLTFIVDVYTRRILGYAASKSLRAEANIKALKMALKHFKEDQLEGCVHHSDRGTQYNDGRYLSILRSHQMTVSMGAKAQDNAFAERVNGVIKNEYLIPRQLKTFRQLTRFCRQAVKDYNTKRHHGALGRRSPLEYERDWRQLPNHKRKVEVIRSEETPTFLQPWLQTQHIDNQRQYPYCSFNLN